MTMQKKIMLLLVGWAMAALCAGAAEFFIHDGDRVVFLGDSITQQKLYTTYIEAYALTRHPDWQLVFRNTGWGGDTAWLRQRAHPDEKALFAAAPAEQQAMVEKAVASGLGRDVLPLKPTVVTIKFGMNDHAYQPFRPDIFAAYVASQKELVKVLKQNGARVALLTPQPIEDKKADPDKDVKNLSLRKFSDGLQVVAKEQGAAFVDQFAPYMAIMMQARATNPQAHIGGGDAVHPGPAGHTLMAWAILKQLGATPLVSSATLKLGWWNRASVENCNVSDLKLADGVLSFDRIDRALPMPIDPRAVTALKLAPVLDELDRYELKVTGLKAASYAVTIDGEAAGTVTAAELAAGWNMALADGPITKQAQEVLQLVFKKNDVFFDRWRNVQLKPGREADLPKLDAEIAELEAKLNTARLPKVHHFELKPVGT
jgi:lysophospholipase L1-like esterase